jgi:hypothetical protein
MLIRSIIDLGKSYQDFYHIELKLRLLDKQYVYTVHMYMIVQVHVL